MAITAIPPINIISASGESGQFRLATLGFMPVQLRIFHAGAVALAGAKKGELGLSLQPGR